MSASVVDFDARLEDHQCLLVLVQPLSSHVSSTVLWERAVEHIGRVRCTRLSDTQQPEGSRSVWLRYTTSYPADGSLWGDFQAHRRVLGVLTVGECGQDGVEALCRLHEQLLQQHPTAIDSRCLLFGAPRLEEDASAIGGEQAAAAPLSSKLRSTQCLQCFSLWLQLYPELEGDKLERDIGEFAASLAWVLESRRLERLFDRHSPSASALPLLKAPFEDFVGLDTESRQFRRRCGGRHRKQLGDLSLQLGLGREAQALYTEAQELLRGVPDWLWLAATLEGAVAAAAAVAGDGSPEDGRRSGAVVEEGWEQLRESCIHYAKYSPVAAIQAECAIKAARWLSAQGRPLGAAEFVQSVVSMNMAPSEAEKVSWYGSLAHLYLELGLGRKAAFYTRVAALKCMAGKQPDPVKCYQLLLKSLPGYRVSLDKPAKGSSVMDGWPRLQIQLLQDLLVTARKMDDLPLAVSHVCQLLEWLLEWLSPGERSEACQQLQALAGRLQGPASARPPLLHLPLVRRFQPQAPAPHLRPMRLGSSQVASSAGGSSPFIFSPLQPHRRPGRAPLLWVQGEVAAVALQLCNPLPTELAVQHMSLLADGVPLESFPASLELPPESSPYPVKLLGTPRATGQLQLRGYSTCVLGVHSECVLAQPTAPVTVVPPLPLLEATANLPLAPDFATVGDAAHVVNNYALSLYAGERRQCMLTVTNSGAEPIEMLELSLQTKLDRESERSLIQWSTEDLLSQLPLPPGGAASIALQVHGQAPFLVPGGSPEGSQVGLSKVVEVVVQLRYSGGPGLQVRYCRQQGLALTLQVQPSLLISGWDVLPAQEPTQCHLVLDLRNETEHELELLADDERQPLLLEAKDCCRIPVTVQRCSADSWPCAEKLAEVACRQHLRDTVMLRWWLPSLERGGEASLDEVPWTSHMLDTIIQSPLQWEVQVDGRIHRPEQEHVFPVGEPLRLSVLLHNVSQRSFHHLWLSAVGYQDRQNGTLSYRLDSKVIFVGSDKLFIEQAEPGASEAHEFTIVFLLTGVYKLELSCQQLDDERVWKCCQPIEITVAPPQQ
ncbi:trafficking protein particle complex subunit 9 isoform X1 [Dermacentor andersoni]|uniref:trafficking protein particle complex subunit 9 isoform X1 n=1 Tax=Dermacentor andersoni TaxID=34620 RepID=UPI00241753B2|nr:protein brunelleschi-like isoform X1 [Dermacentor andersoni]